MRKKNAPKDRPSSGSSLQDLRMEQPGLLKTKQKTQEFVKCLKNKYTKTHLCIVENQVNSVHQITIIKKVEKNGQRGHEG